MNKGYQVNDSNSSYHLNAKARVIAIYKTQFSKNN
jgi:hypothetical protein